MELWDDTTHDFMQPIPDDVVPSLLADESVIKCHVMTKGKHPIKKTYMKMHDAPTKAKHLQTGKDEKTVGPDWIHLSRSHFMQRDRTGKWFWKTIAHCAICEQFPYTDSSTITAL